MARFRKSASPAETTFTPSDMPLRVRMSDVAAKAGVSVMTVSLALRDRPGVSPAVRDQIRKMADEMGYVRDPALTALAAYRHGVAPRQYAGTLALLIAKRWEKLLAANSLLTQLIRGALDRGRQLGFMVETFFVSDTYEDQRKLCRVLYNRGIQGLLIDGTVKPHNDLPDWAKFSCVLLGAEVGQAAFHAVNSNLFHATVIILDRLKELGYRRPACLLNRIDSAATENRVAGAFKIKTAIDQINGSVEFLDGWNDPRIKPFLKRNKPDVVICQGGALLQVLRQGGHRVPEDIGYCTIDLEDSTEKISGVDQCRPRIASVGIDLLQSMLQRGECGPCPVPLSIEMTGIWTDGTTLRSVADPAA